MCSNEEALLLAHRTTHLRAVMPSLMLTLCFGLAWFAHTARVPIESHTNPYSAARFANGVPVIC